MTETDEKKATWDAIDTDRVRRIAAVEELRILDQTGDPVLEALTRLAQYVTGAASASLNIFDDHLQRPLASVGCPTDASPQEDSMCRVVVISGSPLIVRDATQDERFGHSSLATDPVSPVRFYAAVPLRVHGDVTVGTLCTFDTEARELTDEQVERLQDVALAARAQLELTRVAAELKQAATLDPLTGAVNHMIFDDRVARELARHRRSGTPFLVAMIDLDRFKALNDNYGHAVGDAALKWVAERLLGSIREQDTVGRLGGDEFAVLAEIGEDCVEVLLERIGRAPEGFDPAFTLSVGAAMATDSDDVASLLKRADEAMYEAKRARGTSR